MNINPSPQRSAALLVNNLRTGSSSHLENLIQPNSDFGSTDINPSAESKKNNVAEATNKCSDQDEEKVSLLNHQITKSTRSHQRNKNPMPSSQSCSSRKFDSTIRAYNPSKHLKDTVVVIEDDDAKTIKMFFLDLTKKKDLSEDEKVTIKNTIKLMSKKDKTVGVKNIKDLNLLEYLADDKLDVVLAIKKVKMNILKETDRNLKEREGIIQKDKSVCNNKIKEILNVCMFYSATFFNMILTGICSFLGGRGLFATVSSISGLLFPISLAVSAVIAAVDVLIYYSLDVRSLQKEVGIKGGNYSEECVDYDESCLNFVSSIKNSLEYFSKHYVSYLEVEDCRIINDQCSNYVESMKNFYKDKRRTEAKTKKLWSWIATSFKGIITVVSTCFVVLHLFSLFTPPGWVIIFVEIIVGLITFYIFFNNNIKNRKELYSPEIKKFEKFKSKIMEFHYVDTIFGDRGEIIKQFREMENQKNKRPLSSSRLSASMSSPNLHSLL